MKATLKVITTNILATQNVDCTACIRDRESSVSDEKAEAICCVGRTVWDSVSVFAGFSLSALER